MNECVYQESATSLASHIQHEFSYHHTCTTQHSRRFAHITKSTTATTKCQTGRWQMAGLPQCKLQRLQIVVNAAARLTAGAQKYDHVTQLLVVVTAWLVVWLSGRTSVFGRRTFSVLHSTCSWRVTTYVGKPSAMGQPTRPTQPFIPSGSIDE